MSVYKAISAVAAEMASQGISKTSENKAQGFKFRGIDQVFNTLAPVLVKHGLVILPRVLGRSVIERQTKAGGALFYTVLDVEYDFVCAEDGSKHTIRVVGEAMDSGDKSSNKAMSAAYKYACFQALCIPTEGDNDADATTHEVGAQRIDIDAETEALELIVDASGLSEAWKKIAKRCKDLGDTEAHGLIKAFVTQRIESIKKGG